MTNYFDECFHCFKGVIEVTMMTLAPSLTTYCPTDVQGTGACKVQEVQTEEGPKALDVAGVGWHDCGPQSPRYSTALLEGLSFEIQSTGA